MFIYPIAPFTVMLVPVYWSLPFNMDTDEQMNYKADDVNSTRQTPFFAVISVIAFEYDRTGKRMPCVNRIVLFSPVD